MIQLRRPLNSEPDPFESELLEPRKLELGQPNAMQIESRPTAAADDPPAMHRDAAPAMVGLRPSDRGSVGVGLAERPRRRLRLAPAPAALPAATQAETSIYDRDFVLAYLSNFLMTVATSLLYRYADFIRLLGGSEWELGWIVGLGMFGSLAMRLALGAGVDRHGARGVWLASLVLLGLSCLGHVALGSTHGASVYLLRLAYCSGMAGVMAGSLTFISQKAPPHRLAEMVGMIGTAGFLAVIVGTLLGDVLIGAAATLTRGQIDRMFLVAALLSFVALIFAERATRGEHRAAPADGPRLAEVLRRHLPWDVFLVGVAMGMGINLPQTFLRAFTAELHIPRLAMFFGFYSAAAVITRLLTRRWIDRAGAERVMLLGLGTLAVSQLLLPLVAREWQLIVPGLTFGVAHALLFPSTMAAGTLRFPPAHRGLATTLLLATWDLGILIGSPVAGVILVFSARWGLPPYPTLFWSTAAMLATVALCFAASWRRRRHRPAAA